MTQDRDRDLQLLGEFLDGELPPREQENVRARLAQEPDLARLHDALIQVSTRARESFESNASTLPDLEDSRDVFVRRTLAGTAPWGEETPRRRWLLAAVALGIASVGAAGWLWWRREPSLAAAIEASLEPGGPVLMKLRRAGLSSGGGSLEVRYGSGRQWLVTARDFVLIPQALRLPQEGPVLRADGKTIRVGSDGQDLWLHVEGESEARVRPSTARVAGLRVLDAFAAETVAEIGLERTPATSWPAVRDVCLRVSDETLIMRGCGWEGVDGERLHRFEGEDRDLLVRLWVGERGLTRIAFGLVDLTLERAAGELEEAAYGWRHWVTK